MDYLDSFCRAHTLAYSFIALQEMNLAYKNPIEFWNCACLIADSGGNGEIEPSEDGDEVDEIYDEVEYSEESDQWMTFMMMKKMKMRKKQK